MSDDGKQRPEDPWTPPVTPGSAGDDRDPSGVERGMYDGRDPNAGRLSSSAEPHRAPESGRPASSGGAQGTPGPSASDSPQAPQNPYAQQGPYAPPSAYPQSATWTPNAAAGPPPKRGMPAGAIIGIVVVAVLVVVGIGVAAISAVSNSLDPTLTTVNEDDPFSVPGSTYLPDPDDEGDQADQSDDASPAPSKPATAGASSYRPPLKAGQCVTLDSDSYGPIDPASVEVVPCTREHRAEVIDVVEASPNDTPERRYGSSWCYAVAEDITELWGLTLPLRGQAVVAADADWQAGNRWVACLGTLDNDSYAPMTTALKEMGGGGKATLVPRGTIEDEAQPVAAGSCLKYRHDSLSTYDESVDCAKPHGIQVLGYSTITQTTPEAAAKEAKELCDAMLTEQPLTAAQRQSLRAVPFYNDPPNANTSLGCAVTQWGGRDVTGDARNGTLWVSLASDY